MKLEALFDAVIVKPLEEEETTYGSIVVPDLGKDRNEHGTVIAVGPGREVAGIGFVETIVKEGAALGANCTIVCGIEIGKNSLIGAGSVIIKNVKKNLVMVGNPAKEIGKKCLCKNKIIKKPYKKNYQCSICNYKL